MKLIPAIFAALPLIAHAQAAEEPDTIDTIIITGTRVTDLLANVPNSTTVIDLADIKSSNAASVLDLLQSVSGLQVTQPGGRGGVASVYIRGGEANFTMVLLDGVRVNDPNNTRGGSFDFSTLNVTDIQRIEIVRGPQSAIYGSDALSGVINIITRGAAEEMGLNLHAEIGEEGYKRAALAVSGPTTGNGGFTLHVATVDAGEPTLGNTYISDSITAKLSFGLGDVGELRLFARYSDNEGTSFPEDSGGPLYAVLRTLDEKSSTDFSTGLVGSLRLSESWELKFSAGRYDHEDSYFSPGVAPGVRAPLPPRGAAAELDRLSLSAFAVGDLSDSLRATVGVDYHDVQGASDGFVEFAPGFRVPAGFALERTVRGVFGEFQYQPTDALTLLASIRRDEPDEESGETTTKLGALYDFNDGRTTLRANWGEGFKLPSFFALGSPLVGNPDLRSEKSESVDIGITHRFAGERLAATVTLYRNEFTDLIDFDFELFTNVNRDSVIAQGVEFELDWAVRSDLDVYAEAVYLDLEIDSLTPLRHRPDWSGSLAARWDASEDWQVATTWLFVGETFDSSIPTGGRILEGYNRLDTTVTWRATEDMDWLLSFDNLLDADYQEAIGFPSPGRRARLALRYRF